MKKDVKEKKQKEETTQAEWTCKSTENIHVYHHK